MSRLTAGVAAVKYGPLVCIALIGAAVYVYRVNKSLNGGGV